MYVGKWHIPQVNIPEEGTGFHKVCNIDDNVAVESCTPYIRGKGSKHIFLLASFLNPYEICEYAYGKSRSYPYSFYSETSQRKKNFK